MTGNPLNLDFLDLLLDFLQKLFLLEDTFPKQNLHREVEILDICCKIHVSGAWSPLLMWVQIFIFAGARYDYSPEGSFHISKLSEVWQF